MRNIQCSIFHTGPIESCERALNINDMILCANGKLIGGMTELELEVLLDMSGPELILAVSKYSDTVKGTEDIDIVSRSLGDKMLSKGLGWNELGEGENDIFYSDSKICEPNIHCDELITDNKTLYHCDSSDSVDLIEKDDNTTEIKITKDVDYDLIVAPSSGQENGFSLDERSIDQPTIEDENETDDDNKSLGQDTDIDGDCTETWSDDENPWLGCICGKTHRKPTAVFWIQCDDCQAWYNVSPKCVGFDEDEAENKNVWRCNACAPSDQEDNKNYEKTKNISNYEDNDCSLITPTKKDTVKRKEFSQREKIEILSRKTPNDTQTKTEIDTPRKADIHNFITIGTVVNVAKRTWPGVNKLGGVAKVERVIASEDDSCDFRYDVKYILGGREKNIEDEYVSLNEHSFTDFSSPLSVGTRSSKLSPHIGNQK